MMKALKPLVGMVVLLVTCTGMDAAIAAGCMVNAHIPKTPPANPSPRYSGLQTPAVLSADTAGDFMQAALQAINVMVMDGQTDFVYSGILPQCDNTAYFNFSNSTGHEIIAARINPKGSSWYLIHFQDWAADSTFEPYVLNGEVILTTTPKVKGHFNATLGYRGLKVTSSSRSLSTFSYVLYGTATYTGSPASATFSDDEQVNLSISDVLHGNVLDLVGVSFHFDNSGHSYAGALSNITGRMYVSDVGYLDFDTAIQEHADFFGQMISISDIHLRFMDQNGDSAELKPQGIKFGYLAVDADADGFAELGTRFDLRKLKLDNTAGPSSDGLPQALIFNPNSDEAFVGSPTSIHGRYSHSQLGKILSYSWHMAAVPPGSSSTLTAKVGPDTSFTPDQLGDYMVSLTVSDGTLTSQDFYVVRAFTGTPGGFYEGGTTLGADVRAHVQKVVHLDGRATENPSETYAWVLQVPPGSKATLSKATTAAPSFKPDIPGYYVVNESFGSRQIIAVDENLHFTPAVYLPNQVQVGKGTYILSGDINSDGLDETIAYDPAGDYQILAPQGEGIFSVISTITPPAFSNISIADIDGDGMPDLVFTDSSGVRAQLQQPDHSLGSLTTVSNACASAPYSLGHLGSSTVQSIFISCANTANVSFSALTPDGSGGYTVNTATPALDLLARFAGVADLTGDGIDDAVYIGATSISGSESDLIVVPGNADGSFGTPVEYGIPLPTGAFKVEVLQAMFADVNDDGRTDVVVSASVDANTGVTEQYYLFLQNASGGFDPPTLITNGYGGKPHLASPQLLDMYGDGSNELVLLGYKQSQDDNSCIKPNACGLLIYPWNGSGFGKPVIYPLADQPEDNQMNEYYMSDINGDGIPDIVVTNFFMQYVLYGAPFN